MATKDCDLLVLSRQDFNEAFMLKFRDIGVSLAGNSYIRQQKINSTRKQAINHCKNKLAFYLRSQASFEKGQNIYESSLFDRDLDNDDGYKRKAIKKYFRKDS